MESSVRVDAARRWQEAERSPHGAKGLATEIRSQQRHELEAPKVALEIPAHCLRTIVGCADEGHLSGRGPRVTVTPAALGAA